MINASMPEKIVASGVSLAIGGMFGLSYFVIAVGFAGGRSSIGDVRAILFWIFIWALISWFFVVLPVLVKIPEESRLFTPKFCPVFGAIVALVWSLPLLALVRWSAPFVGIPIITGAVSGFSYAFWLNDFTV